MMAVQSFCWVVMVSLVESELRKSAEVEYSTCTVAAVAVRTQIFACLGLTAPTSGPCVSGIALQAIGEIKVLPRTRALSRPHKFRMVAKGLRRLLGIDGLPYIKLWNTRFPVPNAV